MAAFLTPKEVAERWGCTPEHVQVLCKSGDLPAMAISKRGSRRVHWRISPAALAAYELARTTAPSARRAARQTPPAPPVALDGFTLPEGYSPRFPDLWAVSAPTKKAPVSSR